MGQISKNQLQALEILSSKLDEHNIKFIVIGGLAAILWGSKRSLVDIDILVSSKDFEATATLFKEFVVTKPRHYTKNGWDIQQFILEIYGVTVDVCDGEKLYFKKDGKTHQINSHLDNPDVKEVENLNIPVLTLEELIRYKNIIARHVDIVDLIYIDNSSTILATLKTQS